MEMPDVPKTTIDELRVAFLNDVNAKGLESVHPADLQRAKTSDHWLKRFLAHQKLDVNKALEMMQTSLNWRKENGVNDLKESDIDTSLLCSGIFFPYGTDIDGCTLFIFKCAKFVKGSQNMVMVKKCINYWFERIERQVQGEPITMFFDMEGCGLSNMDLEVIKYFITQFKEYYPYFLNYILIFEMPWVLSAAFKIVKAMLPPEGVAKIKFVNKKDIKTYVTLDQALKCWGGESDYVFSFVPESVPEEKPNSPVVSNNNRKVHFVDGSMSEVSAGSGDKEPDGGSPLKVTPPGIITFNRDGNELVSTLELQNTDHSVHLSYKLKTTSPEKFRVKPSTGCLAPGESTVITVTLFPGFQLGGLSRDKFLVMSTPVEQSELAALDLAELWKNTSGRKVNQHRLKCVQSGDVAKNGGVTPATTSPEIDQNNYNKLSASVAQLATCQSDLHKAVKITQYYQIATVFLILILGIVLAYVLKANLREITSTHPYCRDLNHP